MAAAIRPAQTLPASVPNSAPANAPISNWPSMATLTTPERSQSTPASAPKISGRASDERAARDVAQRHGVEAGRRRRRPASTGTTARTPTMPDAEQPGRTSASARRPAAPPPARDRDQPEEDRADRAVDARTRRPLASSAEREPRPAGRWRARRTARRRPAPSGRQRRRRPCAGGSRSRPAPVRPASCCPQSIVVMTLTSPSPCRSRAARRGPARSRKIAFTSAGRGDEDDDQRLEDGRPAPARCRRTTASGCRRPAARRTAAPRAARPTAWPGRAGRPGCRRSRCCR